MSTAKPLFLLGEARGEYEHRISSSFVGPSGIELLRMLHDAAVIELSSTDRSFIADYYRRGDPRSVESIWRLHPEIYRSNVFAIHPPGNKLEWFCGPHAEGIESYPPLISSKGTGAGRYVRREFEPELDRLAEEILAVDPNLIVCLGNTALWALAGRTGVGKLRGTTMLSTHLVTGYKLLPTYHPAAVLREWSQRPTTVIDLMKAKREAAFPDIRRPACEIWIEPTLEDIDDFFTRYVRTGCDLLSVDIETSGSRVTCIGFAPTPELAIVIPFDDARAKDGNYWPDRASEAMAWRLIRGVLCDGSIPKLFHNGLYDITFLARAYGILCRGCREDTMLLQHSLQPESLKSLGYLGSLYTDHGAWKVDHKDRQRSKTIGRDK